MTSKLKEYLWAFKWGVIIAIVLAILYIIFTSIVLLALRHIIPAIM